MAHGQISVASTHVLASPQEQTVTKVKTNMMFTSCGW